MGKPIRNILISAGVCLLLGVGAWLLLAAPEPATAQENQSGLAAPERGVQEIVRVVVKNTKGEYTVVQGAEGPVMEGFPPEFINPEYLTMLLEECASVQYQELVAEHPEDAGIYGLTAPEATVEISYGDNSALTLFIGGEEPISGGRYFQTNLSPAVMLMKAGRTVRFTMPVEKYIDFVIIPPEADVAPLNELGDIKFSGANFPEPVLLRSTLEVDEAFRLQGLSYGAFTHLIVSPGQYEGNATALSTLVDQLLGLISEKVVDYGCTPEELTDYGFHEPYLQIDFDYKNGKDAPILPYTLRVSRWEDGYIATVNDEGIVYQILDQDFLHLDYDDLILRWFVSPLISDIQALEVSIGSEMIRYELSGRDAKDLGVTVNGEPIDPALFRRYYNLITSAASSGDRLAQVPALSHQPLLTLRYCYRNGEKEDDLLEVFPHSTRKHAVRLNGVCEFTMQDTYVTAVTEATAALKAGQSFPTDWQ